MESFYGGKRGQGFVITKRYDGIYFDIDSYPIWDAHTFYNYGDIVRIKDGDEYKLFRLIMYSGTSGIGTIQFDDSIDLETFPMYQKLNWREDLIDQMKDPDLYSFLRNNFANIVQEGETYYAVSTPKITPLYFDKNLSGYSFTPFDDTLRYPSPLDPDFLGWLSITGMCNDFAKGRALEDVPYNDYVLIETIYHFGEPENALNGLIYRRTGFPDEPIKEMPLFPPSVGDWQNRPDWLAYITAPGAGAEFVGQIRGGQGKQGLHGTDVYEVGMERNLDILPDGHLDKHDETYNVYYRTATYQNHGDPIISDRFYVGRMNSIFHIWDELEDEDVEIEEVQRETLYHIGDIRIDPNLEETNPNEFCLVCIIDGTSGEDDIEWTDTAKVQGYKIDDGDCVWQVKSRYDKRTTQMRIEFTDLDWEDKIVNFRQLETFSTDPKGNIWAKFTKEELPHFVGQLNFIDQIKRYGNHILIKYTDEYYRRHIPEIDVLEDQEQSTVWTDIDGTRWLDCGTMIGGTRVKGLYSSLEQLKEEWPHGFARKKDGTFDFTRREDYGLLAHVEEIDALGNYAIHQYCFDDNLDDWYEVQLNINGGIAAALMWGRF